MRLPFRATRKLLFEQLENRSLLAGDVIQFPDLTFAAPPEEYRSENVSDDLSRVAFQLDRFLASNSLCEFQPDKNRIHISDGRVLVEAITTGSASRLAEQLRTILGADIVASSDPVVTAWIPLPTLRDLRTVPGLTFAKAPITNVILSTGEDTQASQDAEIPVAAGPSYPRLDKIDDKVFAAFAGDPRVAYPKAIYTFPGARQMEVTDKDNPAADLYGVMDAHGTLQVQIYYEPGDVEFANVLIANGVHVGRFLDEYGIMEAWIKESELPLLSQVVATKFVTLPAPAVFSGGSGPTADETSLQASLVKISVNPLGEKTSGQPDSLVQAGDQNQLPGIFAISSPAGSTPFAVDVSVRFSNWLVMPESGSGDARVGEFGRLAPSTNDASTFPFSRTLTATRNDAVTVPSESDTLGHETGLDISTPLSPVTLLSESFLIKPKTP